MASVVTSPSSILPLGSYTFFVSDVFSCSNVSRASITGPIIITAALPFLSVAYATALSLWTGLSADTVTRSLGILLMTSSELMGSWT